MLFSTEPRRLVFTEPSTIKSLLTRENCDPINIGPSMMKPLWTEYFFEFEVIHMKDFQVSEHTVSTLKYSRYTKVVFRV